MNRNVTSVTDCHKNDCDTFKSLYIDDKYYKNYLNILLSQLSLKDPLKRNIYSDTCDSDKKPILSTKAPQNCHKLSQVSRVCANE